MHGIPSACPLGQTSYDRVPRSELSLGTFVKHLTGTLESAPFGVGANQATLAVHVLVEAELERGPMDLLRQGPVRELAGGFEDDGESEAVWPEPGPAHGGEDAQRLVRGLEPAVDSGDGVVVKGVRKIRRSCFILVEAETWAAIALGSSEIGRCGWRARNWAEGLSLKWENVR
ncbi:LUC7 related protein [Striga asiatica]|uniref:LUC7 related protein n=1 Tax=Striga asiatica TaxID=4170 RepID=A0A5A7PVS8_STRAF|nr:LUC7 related protein [Striga asiatica]